MGSNPTGPTIAFGLSAHVLWSFCPIRAELWRSVFLQEFIPGEGLDSTKYRLASWDVRLRR